MTQNQITKIMKENGFTVERNRYIFPGESSYSTFTTYVDEDGMDVMEIKRHKNEVSVNFINPKYEEFLKNHNIEINLVLD